LTPTGRTVLLVVDMLGDYAFPDADKAAVAAERAVPAIRAVRDAARDALVVYADDIQERWSYTDEQLLEHALAGRRPELVEPLLPRDGDIVMRKGQHSAFYGTPLTHLLFEENVSDIVLAGQVTEQCVLYSALDAYLRHYSLTVIGDGVAALDPELGAAALRMMERNMGARVVPSSEWLERFAAA
jgi:nicotinamidase-related amidase